MDRPRAKAAQRPEPAGKSSPAARAPSLAAVKPGADTDAVALVVFMRLESGAREATDLVGLRHYIVNETRKLVRARQIFAVAIDGRGRPAVVAISSLATVNRQSEVVVGVESLVARLGADVGLAAATEFRLPAFCDGASVLAETYPFVEMAWMPLADRRGHVFAGLLLARDTPWTGDEVAVGRRLTDVYAHAWRELATADRFGPSRRIGTYWPMALGLAAMAALALPVPMMALAPVEIVAASPSVIAAELDGVVEAIFPDPSAPVRKGEPLVKFTDTTLGNRADVALQEVLVAEARVRQATILAFTDPRGRHELGLAEAELALKKAELQFARDLLSRTVIRAPADGIAVYADRKALIGRPVVTGERLMEIANPAMVEARIDLAVPDAVALSPSSAVRLFLDVDPLAPWDGTVSRSDYRAQTSASDVLVFRTFAQLAADDRPPPRIGLRGTAQVRGERTVLGLYLLRRPLIALRQWIGL